MDDHRGGTQLRVIPMPTYEDVAAAAAWLCAAFGFRERERFGDPDGVVTTAILETPGGGEVMLGWTGPDYQSPRRHAQTCAAARRWQGSPYVVDGILIVVDDVDAHYVHAQARGAALLSALEDAPHGRLYRAEDMEGHRWMFLQRA